MTSGTTPHRIGGRGLQPCLSTLLADPFSIDRAAFEECVDALVGVGAVGLSWWTLHEMVLNGGGPTGGMSADDIRSRFADAGLTVGCVEAIYGWVDAATPAEAVADAEPSIAIAEAHAAPNLAAVCLGPELGSMDRAVANLAAVADRAGESGVTVVVEFLPWTGIPDLTTCWELLQATGRRNVGVLLDSWHWHRQPGGPHGRHAETLASMPGWAVPVLQVCDAGAEPWDDPMSECMAARPLPGAGVVDHGHLLGLLHGIGADPVVCPEVFNRDLVADEGAAGAAHQISVATNRVLGGLF